MLSKREAIILAVLSVLFLITFSVSLAYAKDVEIVNPAFEKVDIQRVHDDDAAVTCWVLYAPADKAVRSDSYSISCLPNSVIKPKGLD